MLAFFALEPVALCHYYDLFFAGVAEVSSVPLACMELFKLLPACRDEFPGLARAFRHVFTASFTLIRLLYWPFVCAQFFTDCTRSIRSGETQSRAIVLLYMATNAGLTVLQYIWGAKLLRGLVQGDKKPRRD
jgi:hypothetical protein